MARFISPATPTWSQRGRPGAAHLTMRRGPPYALQVILRIVRETRPQIVALAILLSSGALGACSASSADTRGTTSVVASFYPLAEAAQKIGGADVSVMNLTAPGVE